MQPTIRTTERFESSTLPMALLTLDGRLLRVNSALSRLVGIPVAELVDVHTHELGSSEEDLVRSEAALAQARAGVEGGEFAQTWTNAQVGREDIHVRLAWSLMHDPAGNPWYVSVICVDESRRIAAEKQRAREAARFRARFEQSSVPQALCDLNARFVDANLAYCDLLGVERADLIGRPVSVATHPDDNGAADEALHRLLTGELPSFETERLLTGPQGDPIPVLVNGALIRDETGAPESATAYFLDLSALRSLESKRKQQEDLYLALSSRSSDLAIVTDAEGELAYVSPSISALLGYELEEVLGESGWSFVHPDDDAKTRAVFERVVTGGGSETVDVRVRTAAGEWKVMEETMTSLLDTPVGGIVCNLRDISERRSAESAMRASEARLRTIVDTAHEGIWAARPDGSTLHMNKRMGEILGVPRGEMHDRSPEIWDRFSVSGLRQRISLTAQPERLELDYRHPDGRDRILVLAMSPLLNECGVVEGSLAMVTDVTDARRVEDELRHAALHDSLTGLPNRALLMDRLEHAVTRDASRAAVLFVDLDHFKVVNDSKGHAVGDDLLVGVTERLVSGVRPQDTVARFGGDEFVIVCEDIDLETAQQLAADLLAALAVPFDLSGEAVRASASVGIAQNADASASDLLRFADAAMYSAKASGRRRVRVFDAVLADEVEQRYIIQKDLHDALTRDSLGLHYQPVIELASGAVVGVEALARWWHPEHGQVPPSLFVPLAEETGLAADLDRWAVRRALRDVAQLRLAGALAPEVYVAINLSARHLIERGLPEFISAVTSEAGLPPELVVLEITEGTLMEDLSLTIPVLQQLRQQGFKVAVDDFGTGYSSLGYLRDLPISSLKIDRSFVKGIVDDPDALAIVASIVDLAKAIGLDVVAEGVETQEQADRLLRLGCSTAQGWLWSKAVSPEQALEGGLLGGPFRPALAVDTSPPRRRPLARSGKQVSADHGLDRMLELHRGGASLTTIAAALNREGFISPQGVKWHRAAVARAISQVAFPDLHT